MKKIFLSFVIIAFVFATGCEKSVKITPKLSNISFFAEISFYNECYEADITVNESGDMTLQMLSPENINGLIFNIKDQKVTAEYKGLEYKPPSTNLPHTDIAMSLYKLFSVKDREVLCEHDSYFIKTEIEPYSFTVYLSGTGLPLKIEESHGIITVLIKDLKVLK